MITLLSQGHRVDPTRVFAVGFSNGGFMAQLLAARLSARIAGIAAIASGMGPAVAASLQPKAPVSILIMNGTKDPFVPYGGGPVARNRGETIGIDEIVRKWVAANHCVGDPMVIQLPDANPADGARVTKTAYAGCADHSAVVRYRIEGGGHTWPAGPQYLPEAVVGRVSHAVNATQVIWQFFAAHARP